MSILIKGMEMPVFEHQSWDIRKGADGKWYMVDTNAETSDGEWHELAPVPAHGRLIDADALMKRYGTMPFSTVIVDAPTIIPADDSKLSATIKCGGAVTCAVAYSEEVYDKYVDTAGNLRWTGTHSGEHIIPKEESE